MGRKFKDLPKNTSPYIETKGLDLPENLPRMDQLPLFQGIIRKMAKEQKKFIYGPNWKDNVHE